VHAPRYSYRSITAAGTRAQQQTSRTPLLLSINETDGRTPDRNINPALRRQRGGVSNKCRKKCGWLLAWSAVVFKA